MSALRDKLVAAVATCWENKSIYTSPNYLWEFKVGSYAIESELLCCVQEIVVNYFEDVSTK